MKRDVRAAIDIGTVTSRLLIAEVAETGDIVELLRDRAITDLGAGVDETGLLAPESIERVGVAVDRFKAQIDERSAELGYGIPLMAVATSASRDARNSGEFVERLAKAGVDLSIIPGEREAALSFAGASSVFGGERVLVVDSGGGSTEVISGIAGEAPEFAHSFNVGCRRVTERFLRSDPPSPGELREAARWMCDEFSGYVEELREAGQLEARMVAVAGTATSMVAMRDEMEVYNRSLVHGATVTLADTNALLDRLAAITLAERKRVTGLEPGRAPVIVGGDLIMQQLMQLTGIEQFTVSERDILHGIIMAQERCPQA